MIKFDLLKKGTKLSETQYYTVEKVLTNKVQLKNDFGEIIVVDSKYAETCLTAADYYNKEVGINKTEAANLFLSSTNVALTVNFNKKIDEKEVRKQLYNLYPNKGGKILSEVEYKAKVTAALLEALNGEERTMIGRHYGSKDELGRVRFIDMEQSKDDSKDYDTRNRLVDPRTINYMIIRGVKYNVK